MAALTIRDAIPADAPAIHVIREAIVADPWVTFSTYVPSIAEIEAEIAAPYPYLVATDGPDLLGYAYYKQFRGGPGYAYCMEHTIHLDTRATGRGIGRALMRELEARAAAAGVHVLVAAIGLGNPSSIAFHAALGYVETGRMPQVGRKNGIWHDLVLMQKHPGR